jgi:hypothetical protein
LYSSSNINRVIEPGRKNCMEHVPCLGEGSGAYRERDHLEDIGVDGNILSEWI